VGVVDKTGVRARAGEGKPLVIELGCGDRKRAPESIGIDVRDLPGVDLVGNAEDALRTLPAGSARLVSSSHFMEHVDDARSLLAEMARVVRPGGRVEITVPHFSNPYFYSDPTHERFYGLYTLSYWVHDPLLRRTVPHYQAPLPFTLRAADLGFRSPKAFPVRRLLKRPVQWIVNATRGTREFYEENLCWLLPCYEVHFVLERD
jgi:SAM-dependent methyltransferase